MVLQAKTVTTTKYLYSIGTRPVAQNTTAWEYLLPDALGSVRQIANMSGYINLTKDYEPYGNVLNSSGNGASVYGFTGEERDSYIKLLFLRARYMQPMLGIFTSRDPWSGDVMRPESMNGFNYGLGNPVKYTDPSGQWVNCSKLSLWIQCPPQDPLTDEQWKLAKQEAQNFEIPVELVAGTVAVEIVYDTRPYDAFDRAYLLDLPLAIYFCPDSLPLDKLTAKAWLDYYYYHGFAGPGLGPGAGVAQVHAAAAEAAEAWFNYYYHDQHYLVPAPDIYNRLARLILDDSNIRYAAAILRQLADQRTNRQMPHFYEPEPKYNPASLTDIDMGVIYEAYRAGWSPYRDLKEDIQTTSDLRSFGSLILSYLSYYRYKP